MAKTISSLSVILGATVAPLVSGFKQAESATQGLTSTLLNIAAPIASLEVIGGALGRVLDGFGLAPMLKEQSEAIDSTAKLSDRLGIATESLAGLQHAGALAGVSNEQLTGGVEKMLKTLGEAVTNGGAAADAFTDIGLNAQQLANEAPDAALSQIADKLKGIENPAQRAAAACAIFGKSGQELLPLLMSGSEGIAAATKEAGALGLTFSRVDAAKVEAANDAMTRVGEAVMGVERQFVVALSPAIQAAADLITGWGESAVSVVQTYLPGIANIAASVFGSVASIVTGAWNAIYSYVAPVVSGIVGWIGDNWQSMLDTEVEVFSAVYTAIESVFSAVWSVVSTVGSGIADAWNWAMNTLGVSTASGTGQANGYMQSFAGFMKSVSDEVSLVYNSLAFGISNFGLIFEYVLVKAAAGWVTFYNEIGYGITDVIGGYLSWFGQNWANIFMDALNLTSAVFTNMATNAGNFFSGLWSWMKGDGFNFKWTGLTEGFKSTLTDLPTIAARQMGPLEKSLNDEADALGNQLGGSYSDFLKQQDDKAKATASTVKDAFKGAGDWMKNAFKTPDVKAPTLPTAKMNVDASGATKAMKDVKQHAEDLKPVVAGSAEAMQLQFAAAAEAITAVPAGANATAQQLAAAPIAAPLAGSATTSADAQQASTSDAMLQAVMLIYQLIQSGAGAAVRIIKDETAPDVATV